MRRQTLATLLTAASLVALSTMPSPASARLVRTAVQPARTGHYGSNEKASRLLALIDPATPRVQPDNYAERERRLCQLVRDCITLRLR